MSFGDYLDANIGCNLSAGTIADLTKNQIVINAANGTNITCTFVTQRAGQIIGMAERLADGGTIVG